jgi:amidase
MEARTATRLVLSVIGTLATAPATSAAQVEVVGATIDELQEAMASGRTTSAEITRAYLQRIEAYDQAGPRLNTMIWMNADALSQAEALDRERAERGPRGPLHGIPIILKDNYDTYDMPTSAGTLALAGNRPTSDAFQVARLREAGVVILGKSNMHELASGITTIGSLGGQTRNPYDPRRNPGGSSGGTGAAIAASFAAVGWGSDTCGSIRIPAAQNDLVGLRPTKGLSSIAGIIPLSHTQDVGGPLARTVRDLAVALDATVGPDPDDPATAILGAREPPRFVDALDENALEGARIGILADYFGDGPGEAAPGRLVRAGIDRMVELGADTVTVEIPGLDSLIEGSGLIGHEFKWDLIDYLAARPGAPVDSLGEMLGLGLIHEALVPGMRRRNEPEARDTEAYRAARAKREPLRAAVEATIERHSVDALVFPTVRTIPAIIGEPQRGSSCSLSANTGLPALTVPVGFTDGVPIGMEMVGRTLDDARLVALGYAFERATDHRWEPTSTPPLVDGQAPAPVAVELVATGDALDPPRATDVVARGTVVLDRSLNTLTFDLNVVGVEPSEIYAVVLRHPIDGGSWQVARRLSGPGVSRVRTTVDLRGGLRERVDASEVVVEVFTRAQPFGAAGATLRFPG